MDIIKTTDIWTEQHANHYECLNGAFIDGIKKWNTSLRRIQNYS